MFSKGLELCFWHSILSLVCGLNGKFLFRWTRCEDRKGSGKDFLKNPWQSYRPFQVGKVITPNQPWTHLGSCSIGTHPSVSMGNLDARKSCGGKLGRVSFVQRPFQGIRENGRKNYMSFKHIMMVWNTHLTWQPWSRQFRIWGVHSETQGWYWQPWDLIVCLYQASLHQPNLPDVHEHYHILTHARSCESKCQVSWKCQAFQKGTQGMKCCATRNLRRMAAVGQLKHLLWNTSCHSLEPR